jgi:hypothetical protein
MSTTETEVRPFIFDGIRAIRTELIEAVENHDGKAGWRVIRTASGREYVSEGDALDLVDLLI